MMKRLFVVFIFILLIASTAGAMEKKWFYSPSGPLFAPKGTTQYSLNVPFTSSGIGTNSYDMNGSSHYISVADADAFSPAAMSVCAWVQPDTIVGTDTLIARVTANKNEFDFFLATGVPTFRLLSADGTIYIGRSSTVLAADKWTYVCATASDTGATGASTGIDILHNCVAVDAADSNAGSWAGIANDTSTTVIGSESAGANYFDGTLMNVSFWNTNISTAICEAAMSAQNYALYTGSKTNLVAWWDLQSDVLDKHSTYEGTAQGGVAPASTTTYPFKNSSNPVLLANGQVLDQDPNLWGVTKGSLTVVDTSTGTVSETGTTLSMTGATNYTTTGAYFSHTKATGTTILGTVNHANTTSMFSSHSSATLSATPIYGLAFATTNLQSGATSGGALQTIGTITTVPTEYKFAIVGGGFDTNGISYKAGDTLVSYDYGARMFIKGGAYTNWTHVWNIMGDTTATMYATVQQNGATADTFDNIKIPTTAINSAIFQPYALDTFTGSDGDLLTAHTMDVGSGWTKRVSDSVWDIDTNTAELETAGTNPANNAYYRYVTTPTVADGIFSAKTRCNATLNTGVALMFRESAEGAGGINAIFHVLWGDGTNCDEHIQKINNGTITNIYSNAAAGIVNGNYYVLTNQFIGNTLRIYRDGVKQGSDITESFNNTATGAGIATWGAAAPHTYDKSHDNFSVHGATTNGSGTTYDSFFTKYGY